MHNHVHAAARLTTAYSAMSLGHCWFTPKLALDIQCTEQPRPISYSAKFTYSFDVGPPACTVASM